MIEGLISLVVAIVEAVISLLLAVVEFVAGFFVAAGETLTVMDLTTVLVVAFFEFLLWFVLWVIELIVSLFKWCKPRIIEKPVLWRPKPKLKKKKQSQ